MNSPRRKRFCKCATGAVYCWYVLVSGCMWQKDEYEFAVKTKLYLTNTLKVTTLLPKVKRLDIYFSPTAFPVPSINSHGDDLKTSLILLSPPIYPRSGRFHPGNLPDRKDLVLTSAAFPRLFAQSQRIQLLNTEVLVRCGMAKRSLLGHDCVTTAPERMQGFL